MMRRGDRGPFRPIGGSLPTPERVWLAGCVVLAALAGGSPTLGADSDDGPAPAAAAPHGSTTTAAPAALDRTFLLVDDHDVLYRSGTRRRLAPARRRSTEALISQTKPWETAIGWTSVHRDPQSGKYQLWYQAYVGKRAGDKRLECVVCYAESEDGLRFTKPEFDFFPYKEHARTNIVLIGSGGYGDRYCNSVLVDAREPAPERRYKMAYYDWGRRDGREYPGLFVAFSPDGVRWTKHPTGPLYLTSYGGRAFPAPFADEDPYRETPQKDKPPRKTWAYPLTMADAVDVMFDPRSRRFVIFGKMWMDAPDGGGAWKHGMGRIDSDDFLTWSPPRFLLGPDDADKPDAEFHTSPVFFHADRYLCLNQIFDRKAAGAIDIELMTSLDGFRWERAFRDEFFLAPSEPGLFDSRSIFTNSTPVVLPDEIRFYYGAYNQSPVGGVKSAPGQRSGVGMASIPRDRFAYVETVERSAQKTLREPLERIGQITFRPLDLRGCRRLTLNADCGTGAVRVELLDERGFRVRGFHKDESVPLRGDDLRHEAAWRERRWSDLPAGTYHVRIHLEGDAKLFALRFE